MVCLAIFLPDLVDILVHMMDGKKSAKNVKCSFKFSAISQTNLSQIHVNTVPCLCQIWLRSITNILIVMDLQEYEKFILILQ